MKRVRALTTAERALWAHVAATVTPRRAEPQPSMAELLGEMSRPAVPAEPAPPVARTAPVGRDTAPALPPLAPIEKRLKQRLSRGQRSVEATIDLHGYRQADAHTALLRFLAGSQARGIGLVLIVTGKGGGNGGRRLNSGEPGEAHAEGGVLRRLVPLWLSDPALRRLVIGFEQAAPGHGGSGALYVRLRKLR